MLRSDLGDYNDAYIVVKGRITVRGKNNSKQRNKNIFFKDMLHLDHAYQKSITHWKMMQKILILLWQCIIF